MPSIECERCGEWSYSGVHVYRIYLGTLDRQPRLCDGCVAAVAKATRDALRPPEAPRA